MFDRLSMGKDLPSYVRYAINESIRLDFVAAELLRVSHEIV
jgi:hypothetical protein